MEEEDWAQITDIELRKRIQNRLAQRKRRRKIQGHANNPLKSGQSAAANGSSQTASSSTTTTATTATTNNNQQYFQQPSASPVLATPALAQLDGGFEDLGLADFGGDEFAAMGFANPQWGGPAGVSNGGSSGGGLPILANANANDGMRSSALRQSRTGPQQQLYQIHGPPPLWTMENAWEQQDSPAGGVGGGAGSRPTSSAQSISGNQQRPDAQTHYCSGCGFQNSPHSPTTLPSLTTSASSYTSGSSLPTSRRQSQISGSDVLWDHGIDLARLLSQASPATRPSVSAQRRISHRNGNGNGNDHHHHQNPSQSDVFEVEQDEHDQACGEEADPRGSKVFVIYVQTCNCSVR